MNFEFMLCVHVCLCACINTHSHTLRVVSFYQHSLHSNHMGTILNNSFGPVFQIFSMASDLSSIC